MANSLVVSIESTAGVAEGFLAWPGPSRPGVVVVQEWWGIVPHVKNVVQRFAAQGYHALAPDLYHGKSTVDAEEASHLMDGLDWGRAVVEIEGAVRHLRDSLGCDHVGVVGFCMGGALAVLAATRPGVDAFVSFYGFPPAGAGEVDAEAPGLVLFGEHEDVFSVPDAEAFVARQRAAGREIEIVTYPEAGHAFFNDDRPEVFKPHAANDAWRRTLEHFGRHLRDAT